MNLNHLFHKMFKIENGNILIADIDGIEIYDTKTGKFKLLKTKPKQRYKEFYHYKYALLPNERLFIFGGRIARKQNNGATYVNLNLGQIIDLKNDKPVKEFKFDYDCIGLVSLKDGNLLIIGGKKQKGNIEELSNSIYIFNSDSLSIKKWMEIDTPIINPFVFITSDDKVVIIGGEIFEKTEKINNFNYAYTKGSDNFYVINLKDKNMTKKNLSQIPNNDFIVDAIQMNNNTYFLNLFKSNDSFIFLNTDNLNIKKINKSLNAESSLFRYSSVKFDNKIYLFGGKLTFLEGPNEYSLGEKHPDSIDEMQPTVEGCILDTIQSVTYE